MKTSKTQSVQTLIKEVITQTKKVQMLFDGFWYTTKVFIYDDVTNSFKFKDGVGGKFIDAEECYLFETYSM